MTDRRSDRWFYMLLVAIAVAAGLWATYSLTRSPDSSEADHEANVVAETRDRQPVRNDVRASQPRASILGKVVDERDQPLAGALVCASARAKARLSLAERRRRHCTDSDDAGRFVLDQLAPVEHVVAASARGRVPAKLEVWAVSNPAREVTLRLRSGGVRVRGRVLDLGGGEVAGAWVSVGDGFAGTTTDDSGAFELWSAPGRRYLSATAIGYAPGAAEIVAPTQEATIYVAPESSVFGTVVDADTGAPLSGVSIRASLETRVLFSWLAQSYGGSTITDEQGNFAITGLTAGRFTLVVDDREAYGQYPGSVGLRLGQTTGPIEVQARLRTGTRFSGRLVDADSGQPVSDCDFELLPVVRGVDPHGWVETDPDGHFEGRFPPGDYRPRVAVFCATHVMARDQPLLTLGTQPRDDLVFELQPAAMIAGTLLDESGQPFDDALVTVHSEQFASGISVASDGSFRFTGLSPGVYELEGKTQESPMTSEPARYQLRSGESITDIALVLPRGATVTGTLVDQDGEGIGAALISAVGHETREARTTSSGGFSLVGLADGTYAFKAALEGGGVLATPDGSSDVLAAREIVAADSPVSIELRAERAKATITGEVMDDDGPVGDAYVVAQRETAVGGALMAVNQLWDRQPGITEIDGSFTLRGLPEGQYTIRAFRRDGSEGYVEHVQTGSFVTITFEPTASLSGIARSGDGQLLDEFTIRMRDPSGGGYRQETFMAQRGRFHIEGLRPGPWSVELIAGGRQISAEVTLEPGEDRRGYELALVAGVELRGRVVDALTGEGVPDILVHAGMFHHGGQTDADGRFTITDVPPGKATITARVRSMMDVGDYLTGTITVTVPEAGGDIGELPVVPRTLEAGKNAGDFGITLEQGTSKIAAVRPGSPAAAAGVPVGCLITQMNGRAIEGNATLVQGFLHVPAGTTVRWSCDGETDIYSVTAGAPR